MRTPDTEWKAAIQFYQMHLKFSTENSIQLWYVCAHGDKQIRHIISFSMSSNERMQAIYSGDVLNVFGPVFRMQSHSYIFPTCIEHWKTSTYYKL